MVEPLSEVEYGRILGSFTAVAEDFGDTVAPDAIPLTGKVTFTPTISHVSYINSDGETASLYLSPIEASIVGGRLVGSDGNDGVTLLASNSNNVSASVLWNASIHIDPLGPDQDAPEVHKFLIEVRRNEISSLIDVIKANSRVHNVALFHDAIAEAAAKFWERVEAGEFRGNQGPPGPPGVGVGVPGPVGRPGIIGKDGDPGVGGNLLPDGDLEEPGFLVTGDYQETNDAVSGSKAVTLTNATSRKIRLEPETSYIGTVYLKSPEASTATITMRVFGSEGDIDRVIENAYNLPADTWRKVTFLLDSNLGDQSMEIITASDGRTISADLYTLSDNSVVQGLQRDLAAAQAQLEAAMAQLDLDLAEVESNRVILGESLKDLAVVLEDADVDLTELNQEMADLKSDLAAEETKRQEADAAAQVILDQLDTNLSQAKQELVNNKVILETLDTDLATAKAELLESAQSIETLETVTLPELRSTLEAANTAAIKELNALDDKLYGAEGDITSAKASIAQLAADLTTEAQTRAQLALDIQVDFEARDTRLAEAEGILSAAFPDGAVNVPEELSRTIRESVVQYAVSNSAETPPTTGWSAAAPNKDPGQYIWFRTLITYGDNSTSPSSAALLTGNTGPGGPQGPAGEDGKDGTGVTILGSRDSEDQLPTTGNAGDAYLVGGYLYVWSSGSWSNVGLIRGPQGVPGPAGEDGKPRYTWVKYASSASGDGISDDPAGKTYIGLAHNKPTAVESDNPGDYRWALIQGPQGSPGIQGPAGKDGTSLYTWLKYATTPTTGMSDSPVGKDYIGLAYNKTTPTESDNYTDYQWTLIKGAKGDQGVPGEPGEDGTPRYTWVKYATSASGAGMSDDPTGKTYIGLAYNKTTQTESSMASDYQWALIQGPKGDPGPQGIPGPDGADGESLYTWIKYADTPTSGMADLPAGKKYMGIAYNKPTATESSSYSAYEWSLIEGPQGNQGVQGPKGADGKTTYTWIKYGTSSTGAGMSDSPTGKTHIGIAYNKPTATESNTASDYQWSLIQGPQGEKGGTGPQGIGISRITPYYRAVVRGAAAPADPTTATPSGWDTSEPTWVPNRDLYRVEKITYTNNTFAYTAVTKIAAYAGIDAAMAAANGKNLNTYTDLAPASKPGPAPAPNSARTVGDIHRNRDSSTGEIWAEYQWTGSAWKEVSYGDEILRSLDVGKVTGGTGAFQQFFADKLIADDATITKLWTDQLVGKTITAQQVTVAPGNSFPDPSGLVEGTRNSVGGAAWSWDDAGKYWKRPAVNGGTTQFNAYLNTVFAADSGPLVPGETYRLAYDVWVDGTTTSSHDRARFAINYRKLDGTTSFIGDGSGDGDADATGTSIATNEWVHVERNWIAPSDAVSGGFSPQIVNTNSTATEVRIRNIFIGVKAGAVSIKDGAISADKINAESVGAAVGKFINLETSQLVATDSIKTPEAVIDKLWTETMSTKKVFAENIVVSSGNLITDRSKFDDTTPNTAGVGRLSVASSSTYGKHLYLTLPSSAQTWTYGMWFNAPKASTGDFLIDAQPSTEYRFSFGASAGGTMGGTMPRVRIVLYCYDVDGTYIAGRIGTIQPLSWSRSEWSVTTVLPDNCVYVRPCVSYEKDATTGNYTGGIRVYDPTLIATVGAVQISDGAVNASKINAESVGAAVGAFVKLDVKNLTASSANINSLVAQKIAAGTAAFQTVNADKIIASTGTMDSATINQIWADGIAAKSLTANRVIVSSGNIVENADFSVSTGLGSFWSPSSGMNGGASVLVPAATRQRGTYDTITGATSRTRVVAGRSYKYGVWVRTSATLSGTNGVAMYLTFYDDAGTRTEGARMVASLNSATSGVWTFMEGAFLTPEGSTNVALGYFANASYPGAVRFSEPSVIPMTGAVLIEDGAVSANHLTSNSVDTDHLRANAVDAGKIKAGAVTTDKMVANTIDGDRIRANTLHADKILANTITASKIASKTISAEEIKARTILASNIVASTITANEIKARTITAAEILAGTITANELDVGNITSNTGFIDNLWTNGLSAKSITAARVAVNPGNLIPGMSEIGAGKRPSPDPFSGWTLHSSGYLYTTGTKTLNIEAPIPVQAGVKYKLSFDINGSIANTRYFIQIIGANADGSAGGANPGISGSTNTYLASNVIVSGANTWYTQEYEWTPANNGYAFLRFYTNHPNGTSTSTTVQRFRRFSLQSMIGSTLIEGGAIDGQLITGATIRTAASGARVQLDSQGIRAYNSSGTLSSSISALTGEVNLTGNITQRNSYGSAIFGPQPYVNPNSTPGLTFSVPGKSWYGPGGVYARDDDSAGHPTTRMQGFIESVSDGSHISLAPGGPSTDVSTYIERMYTGGQRSGLYLAANNNATLYSGEGTLRLASRNVDNTVSYSRINLQSNGSAFLVGENVYVDSESHDGSVTIRKRNTGGTATGAWFQVSRSGVEMYAAAGNSLRLTNTDTYMNGIIGRYITGPSSHLLVGNGGVIGVEGSSRRWKTEIETVDPATYADGLLSIDFSSWLSREDVEKAEAYRAWREDHPMTPVPEEFAHVDEEPVRQFGVIAEQLAESGVPGIVGYDEEGLPSTVDRANIGVALVPIVKQLLDRVDELERIIGEMNG